VAADEVSLQSVDYLDIQGNPPTVIASDNHLLAVANRAFGGGAMLL
jgi:hypothetical protein